MAASGLAGFSNVGTGATGGTRTTALCKKATLNSGAEILFNAVFICGNPHRNTNRLSNIHGSHARAIAPEPCTGSTPAWGTSSQGGNCQTRFGRQKRSNTATATIEQMEATMSTSHGPW